MMIGEQQYFPYSIFRNLFYKDFPKEHPIPCKAFNNHSLEFSIASNVLFLQCSLVFPPLSKKNHSLSSNSHKLYVLLFPVSIWLSTSILSVSPLVGLLVQIACFCQLSQYSTYGFNLWPKFAI